MADLIGKEAWLFPSKLREGLAMQGQGGAAARRASAAEQPSGLRKVKRPGGPLGSQAKARKGTAAGRPSMAFEEGFS